MFLKRLFDIFASFFGLLVLWPVLLIVALFIKVKMPGVSFLKNPSPAFSSNHWLPCVIIEPEESGYTRENLRLAMEAANIETRPLWKPMHMQPVFKDAAFYGNGLAEELFNKGLCLPSGPVLTQNDLERVVEVFRKIKS